MDTDDLEQTRGRLLRGDLLVWRPAGAVRGPHPTLSRFLDGSGWIGLKVACDLVALVAGCLVGLTAAPTQEGAPLLCIFPPLALVLMHLRARYADGKRDLVLDDVAPGFGAVSISAMTVLALLLLTADGRDSVSLLMMWTWVTSLAAVTFASVTLAIIQRAARARRLVESPTLVVGTDVAGLDIALRLSRHPEYGLRPVGFLGTTELTLAGDLPPVLGGLEDLERVVAAYGVRTVIVGHPDASTEELLRFVVRCDRLGMQTSLMPRLAAVVNHETRVEYLGAVPLLHLRAFNPESWRFSVKHAIDRFAASVLLILLSPLLAVLAIAVLLSSPGPVLYRQLRAGRDGRLFNLFKFRTMIEHGGAGVTHELPPGLAPGGVEGVDRRTRVGRILRRTSLDELPQLMNVVRGEMSVVGPRPERPEFAELFRHEIERYHDRHRVRSGITGWAQVHGLRGQTALVDRVELDNFYIEHWSLALDLKIMVLTIPALLRGS